MRYKGIAFLLVCSAAAWAMAYSDADVGSASAVAEAVSGKAESDAYGADAGKSFRHYLAG